MIIQSYNFKGIPLQSALKITGVNATQGNIEGTFNVTVQINRYTCESCEYDIEQFYKSFIDIPNNLVDGVTIIDLSAFEGLLLAEPEFQWATQVSLLWKSHHYGK